MELRALLVCSDRDAKTLLPLIRSEMGMEVEHTSAIARGLDLVDSRRFDVVVIDYRADESSEQLLAHVRGSAKNRHSLLIAVVESDVAARLVFSLGVSFVLFHPLSSERTRVSLRVARNLLKRERRQAPRKAVGSAASVAFPGAPELNTVLANLSEGGTAIQTAQRIPSNCKVYFEFSLPGQTELIRLSGEMAWQDASGRTGINFLDVPQSSRRLMQKWLEQEGRTGSVAEDESAVVANRRDSDKENEKKKAATLSEHQPAHSKHVGNSSSAGNRRDGRRFQCQVGAEVYAAGNKVPIRCTVSDISEGGCYVEMPSPLTGQPRVEIVVRTEERKFRIRGQVLNAHPGFGMGVRFLLRNSDEREEILRLLGVLAAEQSAEASAGLMSESAVGSRTEK